MKKISSIIKHYLKERPAFYAYLRPQEAILFYERLHKIKGPILDFGCGDGFFANSIFRKKFIDVGLDIPSSHIEEAQKLNLYKSLAIYTGNKIPFKKNYFGTIISNCVFEHVPHIEKSIQEMHRVLKNNGLLMTTVMCSSWNDNLLGGKLLGKRYVDWFNGIQHHDSLLSKKEWTSMFITCGYEIIETVDYLYEKASKNTEIHHFLSIFSLLTYKLFRKWKLHPFVSDGTVIKIEKLIREDKINPSACFFILKKI